MIKFQLNFKIIGYNFIYQNKKTNKQEIKKGTHKYYQILISLFKKIKKHKNEKEIFFFYLNFKSVYLHKI